jgi:uncharacterized membrane protein HdeD (DUF308 family)
MAQPTAMPICPMAETCKGMMEKPTSGFMLIIPGLILIALGVAVVLEPRILVWLVAIVLVAMGAFMLVLAMFMRKVGMRFRGMHG